MIKTDASLKSNKQRFQQKVLKTNSFLHKGKDRFSINTWLNKKWQ